MPTSQKGWTEIMEEPISLCAPTPCSASLIPLLDFPRDGKQGARGIKATPGPPGSKRNQGSCEKGSECCGRFGIAQDKSSAVGEEQDLRGGVEHTQHHSTHSS